jgi:hypothetical protein
MQALYQLSYAPIGGITLPVDPPPPLVSIADWSEQSIVQSIETRPLLSGA